MQSTQEHPFFFDDPAAAARGAARLRLATTKPSGAERAALKAQSGLAPDERAPPSHQALQRLLTKYAEDARVESIDVRDVTVVVGLQLHDDLDAHAEDEGARVAPTARLQAALERFMGDVGGLTKAAVEARERARARDAALAAVGTSGPELLARLDAVADRLLRYERVFVDSLRTSVAAGSVLDGQRLEALEVLRRVAAADAPG